MKKSIPIVATLGALVVGIAVTSTALAGSASTATTDRNSKLSGASVIAWNQELLKIVQTPGAQPATVHQTRSYAMLHAAIDDAIVSITHDGSPLLVSVKAPHGSRPDAAAIEAGRATLTALYPGFKGELAQLADGQLATIPNGADKQHGIQVGDAVAAKVLNLRA
ncbi:MAG TPA: haloperoxidase, partial [Candidatus Dormibacteraeota bacterium]|nr:haloperoxidase [Candidatus Dormibacteraeota bacterium]